jgi:GntR family transcriptional regulator, rspAB operon transcriptional repressor
MSRNTNIAVRLYSKESLAERAYQSIRDRILRGQYPIGAVLSRRQLAKELRMSFLPVSEALQHLEIDGLVESKPRVGTRVRVPTREEILERYGLREALETQAARLCAEHADPNNREELRNMGYHLDQLYASSAGADDEFLYSVHTYHLRFHLRIAEIGGNSLLRRAIEREQVLVFNWLFDTAAKQRSLPPRFHSELATALTGPTIEGADEAMRAHVRYGMDRILGVMGPAEAEAGNGWRVLRRNSTRERAAKKTRPARKRSINARKPGVIRPE